MANSKATGSGEAATLIAQRGRPREFDRDKAVNVAMEVFWKQGYMQTTLGDLCKALGITAPSFYCAFGTKADLFLETASHYAKIYWEEALDRFRTEENIYIAIKNFLTDAIMVYMRPNLPKGCFFDISLVGLSSKETRIMEAITGIEKETREIFRERLLHAIDTGQLPPESDIPAITGSLLAFLKGLASLARKDLCQTELLDIASRGILLLPAPKKI